MRRTTFAILAMMTVIGIHAQSNNWKENFVNESFTLGSTTLAYRKAFVNEDNIGKPCLVLYLHGGTSRGDDNEAQLNEAAVAVINQYLSKKGIYAIMVVPQCPKGGGWTSPLRRVVNELIKSLIVSDNGDANRIYVMGGSMGGTGTWAQLSYFPNFYAAAMPVAGNPTGLDAVNVSTTPVLTVMGTADRIMSISTVEDFQSDVLEAGGTLILETETGWTHENTCEQSYTDERLDWLFSNVRSEATSIDTIPQYSTDTGNVYDLTGRVTINIGHGIFISNGKKIIK